MTAVRKVKIKRPGVPGHDVGEVVSMTKHRALACVRDGLADPVGWNAGAVTNRMMDARYPGVPRQGKGSG